MAGCQPCPPPPPTSAPASAPLTLRDEHRLRGRLDRARAAGDGEALAAVAAEVAEAEARVARRRDAVPRSPTRVPAHRGAPRRPGRGHPRPPGRRGGGRDRVGQEHPAPQAVPGAGPGRARPRRPHLQPRLACARTVAARVADELGTTVGDLVGYTVRFSDQVGERTLIKLMTDGILLAEMQRDRMLRRYDTLIVDEAHERSLNIDFLLGYLTNLLPAGPTSRSSSPRPPSTPSGSPSTSARRSSRCRAGPTRSRSATARAEAAPTRSTASAGRSTSCVARAPATSSCSCRASGRSATPPPPSARPPWPAPRSCLYARLSAGRAAAGVPAPRRPAHRARHQRGRDLDHGARRALRRRPRHGPHLRFSRRTKVQRLPIEPVSQASADQRAGRCGRVAPGICIRLYGEDDYDAAPFTSPEILRTNLASVILQMAALGLGDVESFPFVDPPDAHAVRGTRWRCWSSWAPCGTSASLTPAGAGWPACPSTPASGA